MDTIIEEWKKLLDEFKGAVDKDLEEIHKCKAAVQDIRPDYVDKHACGRFIRSNDPIIISSPNIIIGNVDADGSLIGGTPSKILLRASNIGLEGVGREGECGSIVSKATVIRQIAVDPGIDGLEAVVMPESEIVSQAKRISINSCSDDGFFVSDPHNGAKGISIKSDTAINIDSSVPLALRKTRLKEISDSLDTLIRQYKSSVDRLGNELDETFRNIDQALSDADTMKFNNEDISSRVGLLDCLRQECENATIILNDKVRELVGNISRLAEAKRQKSVVTALKDALPEEKDYNEKGSGTRVNINADTLSLSTYNGDGKECVNPEAGVFVESKCMLLSSLDADGAILDGSSFSVASMSVEFNSTDTAYEDKTKKQKGTLKTVGDFNVYARKVNVKSVDSQFDLTAQNEADKHKETGVSDGSFLNVRIGGVDVSTVGTDGKAAGSIVMNSKTVDICSIDLDKDKKADKLNEGGQIVLRAEKVTSGCYDDKFKTARAQVLSKETVVQSEGGVSLMQDKDNGVFIKGNAVSVGSTNNTITGPLTVNGATKVDNTLNVTGNTSLSNLAVSGEFKSNALSDGFKSVAAGSSEKAKSSLEAENPAAVQPGQSESLASVRAVDDKGKVQIIKHEDAEK